jgi:hypothetical protein
VIIIHGFIYPHPKSIFDCIHCAVVCVCQGQYGVTILPMFLTCQISCAFCSFACKTQGSFCLSMEAKNLGYISNHRENATGIWVFHEKNCITCKGSFFSATWLERHVNNASAHLDSSLSASPALRFGGPTTRGIENWAIMPHLSIAGTSGLSLDKIFLFAHDTMNFDVPLPNYGGFMSSDYMVCEFWVAKACLDS